MTAQAIEINRNTLPANWFRNEAGVTSQAALEAAGVKFLGPVEGDPLFQHVELPAGWSKRLRSGGYYYLLDHKGRQRACISHEEAPFDEDAPNYVGKRYAFMGIVPRFKVMATASLAVENAEAAQFDVVDDRTVVFTTEEVRLENQSRVPIRKQVAAVEAIAEAWLDARYPDWRDPGAHWD